MTITVEHEPLPSNLDPDDLTGMTVAEAEKAVIESSLKRNNGDRAKAAADVGMGERTMYRKLKEYGLVNCVANPARTPRTGSIPISRRMAQLGA